MKWYLICLVILQNLNKNGHLKYFNYDVRNVLLLSYSDKEKYTD